MAGFFHPCALIPTYDNPDTVRDVVHAVRTWLPDVVVVDDGSAREGRRAVEELASVPRVHVHRRERNGGKGAAVKDGFRLAHDLGFTHALQVDADGQHALDDIPLFLETARARPDALILGAPEFDDSAPRSRVIGRRITCFWTNIETYGRRTIRDPMCGFRVYPLREALQAEAKGNSMSFDPEIAVRLVWRDVPVVNLTTRIRYLEPEEGGVSHFRLVRDNASITWLHTRLVVEAVFRLVSSR